jgi:hypothetical protein
MNTVEIKREQAIIAITEQGCETVVHAPITALATIITQGPQGPIGPPGVSFSGSEFLDFPAIEALDSGDTGATLQWNGNVFTPASGIIDSDILQPAQILFTDVTLENNRNGLSVGTVTIASGITITVPSGAVWLIID